MIRACLLAACLAGPVQADASLLDPCRAPHATVDDLVAVFVTEGASEVTSGPVYDAAISAAGEIWRAVAILPRFRDTAHADEFLRSARDYGLLIAPELRILALQNTTISIRSDDRSTRVYCLVTADSFPQMPGTFEAIDPVQLGSGSMALGVQTTDLTVEEQGDTRATLDFIRMFYPADVSEPVHAPLAILLGRNLVSPDNP